MKQVKWRRNLWFFIRDAADVDSGLDSMYDFMKKYNCKILDSSPDIVVCDEEDFVAIMLSYPNVVMEVFK